MNSTEKKTALAIFVKTPGLSPVKTRLAAEMGVENATSIYLACVKSVEAVVRKLTESRSDISVVWAVAEAAGLASPFWSGFPTTYQGEGELAARLGRIYNRLKEKHDNVILIGGDTPHIPAQWISNAIASLSAETEPVAVFGPSRDGGFYLFGANFASAGVTLTSVEYSVASTVEELSEQLFTTASLTWLPQLTDIDERSDIVFVGQEIATYQNLLEPAQIIVDENGTFISPPQEQLP